LHTNENIIEQEPAGSVAATSAPPAADDPAPIPAFQELDYLSNELILLLAPSTVPSSINEQKDSPTNVTNGTDDPDNNDHTTADRARIKTATNEGNNNAYDYDNQKHNDRESNDGANDESTKADRNKKDCDKTKRKHDNCDKAKQKNAAHKNNQRKNNERSLNKLPQLQQSQQYTPPFVITCYSTHQQCSSQMAPAPLAIMEREVAMSQTGPDNANSYSINVAQPP